MAGFNELRLIASPQGFTVLDSSRRKLSVHAVDVMIRPGHPPFLHIALPAGNIDVVGNPIFAVVDVATGRPRVVKRIEWADGAATDFPVPEKMPGQDNAKAVFTGNGQGAEPGSGGAGDTAAAAGIEGAEGPS